MEFHRKAATEAKELAEETIVTGNDVSGAMTLALKARRLYPELKGIDQLISVLDVLLAAADSKDHSGKRDYYRILQLDPRAEDNVIKKQYRKIALNVHPDKNPSVGAEEAFKLVTKAFEVLSDERKRALYDQGACHGLSDISQVKINIEILLRKIRKSYQKSQKIKKDIEKLQTGEEECISKNRKSNEEPQKIKRDIEKLQTTEEECIRNIRKSNEDWQKIKKDIEKLQTREEECIRKIRKSNEDWQKIKKDIQKLQTREEKCIQNIEKLQGQ